MHNNKKPKADRTKAYAGDVAVLIVRHVQPTPNGLNCSSNCRQLAGGSYEGFCRLFNDETGPMRKRLALCIAAQDLATLALNFNENAPATEEANTQEQEQEQEQES
jgi:hypothetical protein